MLVWGREPEVHCCLDSFAHLLFRLFFELSSKLILECLRFNNVRRVEEVERLQILYASVYLDYRKTRNYSGNSHNHSARSAAFSFHEKSPNWIPIFLILMICCLRTPTPPVLNWWPIDHILVMCVRARENNRILWYDVTAWLSPVFSTMWSSSSRSTAVAFWVKSSPFVCALTVVGIL